MKIEIESIRPDLLIEIGLDAYFEVGDKKEALACLVCACNNIGIMPIISALEKHFAIWREAQAQAQARSLEEIKKASCLRDDPDVRTEFLLRDLVDALRDS